MKPARPLLAFVTVILAGCSLISGSPSAAPQGSSAPDFDATGILLVSVGEQVQAAPQSEEMATALSNAIQLAEGSTDLGYPWIDPTTGGLVLSAVNTTGRATLAASGFTVPFTIRDVAHGGAELQGILDDVTFLGSRGVPKAELIYMAAPDHRDNRVLIVMSAMDRSLLDYLAQHYPTDALAVEVDPSGGGGQPAST
jgi:hypothetical protein